MKRFVFGIIAVLLSAQLWSLELPESLYGIWEGKDRYVFFEEQKNTDKPLMVILLKEYYGWYLDRTAEPVYYKEIESRTRNAGTTKDSLELPFTYRTLNEDTTKDAWEFCIDFTKRDKTYIPVCISNGKMYLDFFVKQYIPEELLNAEQKVYYEEHPYDGHWFGNVLSKGFTVSPQSTDENIGCIVINEGKLFDIRYWKTDMDYTAEPVMYKLNDVTFYVPKHLYSGNQVYSSVSGRSKKIRNPQSGVEFKPENYTFNDEKTLLIRDKEPYLVQLADKSTLKDIFAIVKATNSRKAPPAPPQLPPHEDLDWHWDMIDALETNNELIQAVRERQKAFGVRGKDSGK